YSTRHNACERRGGSNVAGRPDAQPIAAAMSVSSLTTIAAAREVAPGRRPSKGEIGKVPAHHADAGQGAGVADVLAKQLPTELVAPYTALTAAIVATVAKPTPGN